MAKNRNSFNLWVVLRVLESLLLIVTGVLSIIYSSDASLQKVIFILVGVFLIIDGGLRIMKYFMNPLAPQKKAVVTSVFEFTIGVMFCIKAGVLVGLVNEFLTLFIGILLIVVSVVFILMGTVEASKKRNRNMTSVVVNYAVGILLLAGGLYILIQGAELVTATIIVAGVLFILAGVAEFVYTFYKPKTKTIQ